MQRVMASEAEATREARSKLIAAQGEEKASRCLREAAQTLADTPIAVQLRYLQTLNMISTETDSTIVFPIPIDLTGSFACQENTSGDKKYGGQSKKNDDEIGMDFSIEPDIKQLSSLLLGDGAKKFKYF